MGLMDDEDLRQRLEGKKLVVTGGSNGIGKAIVERASQLGANVLFTYNAGEGRAKELAERTGAEHRRFVLGSPDSTKDFIDSLRATGHVVNYFIANAGRELSGDLSKHSFSEMQAIFDANLLGNLYLLQNLIISDSMVNGGQVAVIGSIAADGNHDQLAYSASKSGLRGAVESLFRYDGLVKKQVLGVKLIEPAFVRTPMTERILKVLERRALRPELVAEFNEKGYIMDAPYAAQRILELTVDPTVVGRVTIPANINLHEIRERYFKS